MTKIIFATGNKDKMREIREIMSDMDVEIYSMKEAGINVEIIKDGQTFEDNARIKAETIAQYTDPIVLAADPGLEAGYEIHSSRDREAKQPQYFELCSWPGQVAAAIGGGRGRGDRQAGADAQGHGL